MIPEVASFIEEGLVIPEGWILGIKAYLLSRALVIPVIHSASAQYLTSKKEQFTTNCLVLHPLKCHKKMHIIVCNARVFFNCSDSAGQREVICKEPGPSG